MSLTSLNVGESKFIKEVDPSEFNCPTGLIVKSGERYAFMAKGQWIDWFIHCGPDGWGRWNPLKVCNRLAGMPFFLLCGNVGKDERFVFPAYCVKAESGECAWSVPPEVDDLPDHQLYLFANDWYCAWAYRNNKTLPPEKGDSLAVTITRLK